MTPQRLLRSLARMLPLLLLSLALPNVVLSQTAAPGPAELAPEARERLAQAAGDSLLAPWQRDLMLRLARTGGAAALDSSAADPRATLPALVPCAADGVWNQPLGPGLYGHSAIYDPVRDRMVVFGGSSASSGPYLNDVWALSLADTPVWTELTPSGTSPSARYDHSAIYDPVRDRMVVFGGYSSSTLNDVWTLSLADTPAWTQLTPTGAPTSRRQSHSATYDPVRDRMVVFGGLGSGDSQLNDVCALSLADTPAWTQLTPSGTTPSAREGHSATYDPVRDRMVVFGGFSSDFPPYFNDVWALSLAGTPAWTELTPSGTPPIVRSFHSAIYDPMHDRMVVFGGYSSGSPNYSDGVWALSLPGMPAWTQLTPSGTPPSDRDGHSAIYDPVRDRMVVFGGDSGSPSFPPYFNDVWALSLAGAPAWTQLTPSGTPPSARYGHSAIYDPVRDRMVMFGGSYEYLGTHHLNDVWILSLAGTPAWTELIPTGTPPSERDNHSAIYDPVRDRMVVYGGIWSSNDVWALSLAGSPAWTQLIPLDTPPSDRDGHSAIYDPVRDRMVIFGGYYYDFFFSYYRNDVWELSLAGTPAWTQLTPSGTPPSGRLDHSAIYDPVRDRMVVFGGSSGSPYCLNDVWALSLAGTPAWTEPIPTGTPPSERNNHSAICDPVRDRMVVFGGYSGSYLNDVWALEWSATVAVGDPQAPPLVSGLRPPVPNPTRGTTAVSYALAQAGRVQLGVYDVSGRLVRRLVDGERRAGVETVVWNGTAESGARLQAGMYFVRLAAAGFRETRRVILLK
jgi:hypothetical protein